MPTVRIPAPRSTCCCLLGRVAPPLAAGARGSWERSGAGGHVPPRHPRAVHWEAYRSPCSLPATSTLPCRAVEYDNDNRGATFGRSGFTTGTGDGLDLLKLYTKLNPNNILAKYIPIFIKLQGTPNGLSPQFAIDVATAAANDPKFITAQDQLNDRDYFNPSQDYARQIGAR